MVDSPSAHAPVLIVDDDRDVREALQLLLKVSGYTSVGADSPASALARLQEMSFQAALVDMNYSRDTTSGGEGLTLIAEMVRLRPTLPLIAMTAWANIQMAVEAMRSGATDFIEKPWQNARVLAVLEAVIAAARVRGNVGAAIDDLRLPDDAGVIAESASMRRVLDELHAVAGSDASILLLGENGTGKTLLASRLHGASRRAKAPFVRVDVGGLAPTLFESEMFGHVRGAFTDARKDRVGRFEMADGGTLFLDEIGNLPLEQQPKLLRAIEDGQFEKLGTSLTRRVDVRLVSATNASLRDLVDEGRFRRDLLYRLNTIEIHIPALRERSEDILPLARKSLEHSCRRYNTPALPFSAAAERALREHTWPGNVRELEHAMERVALLARGPRVEVEDLRLTPAQSAPPPLASGALGGITLESAELLLLRQALQTSGGNLQSAAEQLGITRQSLYRRLEKHGLRGGDDLAG
ncbi:sigma-54 dependent transcriptional regulator [Stenotrophomonas sp. SMYL11]|uniref:sigma-54-dependent transcriptional regulator n=1 Tax=Stenotrophomonas sp. SMYL11 TaxID=3076042 RepID=UPI002E76F32E|nr:sigma-54 dependent transcriptional regulator [Stenotrophomonas sp. SMYL11]